MQLRILATSDVHMHLMPYDYLAGRAGSGQGLARAASLIARLRTEVAASILLDNGDFLQGGPMGDVAARQIQPGQTHPAIAAMNAIGYDAAAIGNHDFNYGLTFLRRAAAQARFPMLAANLSLRRGPDFASHAVIERRLSGPDGQSHDLRIGVIGFLPPQTEEWDQDLRAEMQTEDIVDSARRLLPRLRGMGVNLVIALAHSGIGAPDPSPRMEHAATALAALPGIDVVIAGHTHEVFPSPRWHGRQGIDAARGTLAGKPAVMPGFGGSHVGIVDLQFAADPDGALRVADFRVRAEPVAPDVPASPLVLRPLHEAHRETVRQLGMGIGRTETPLCSHFTVIGHDPGLRLVNRAQRWHVRRRLAGTRVADLPVLSASAPYRAGGRGGIDHFTDIAAGRIDLRHLADLYSFPNRVTAIRLNGRQLGDWLERSASMFDQVVPGQADQRLLNPEFPAYNFDVIEGVEWRIDLSQPPRFHPDGRPASAGSRRIFDLRWRGRPVAEDQKFILATNSYRLASCGLFSPLVSSDAVVLGRDAMTLDVLRRYVRQQRRLRVPEMAHWRFAPLPGTSVLFETAPDAINRPLPSQHRLEPAGTSSAGFALVRLRL
ncbi:bifunctional 2',3'-cyclic-nucleotide 2'-phosphodiesterase/3'-nucleotidase [Paracoccus rhizosphaerae]|uniref:Bifunctional 2',3'-cyclic-nucleotide 2'-phosphodiesterase/3'-nucleotidase n=1 Tax=Paracoccus rhizosphaerae TaxID=1133347 RepID=A0ABV6CHN5_9RHOB|nr:bifunctional 2',3'-cyclic-nucleotide 2'-phosphodiesterase/3'-nucleotidase [Paracoccus rhizosphaerae]